MRVHALRILITGSILFVFLAVGVAGQSTSGALTVQRTVAKATRTLDGSDTYGAYCAACHGKEGAGNGPAAKTVAQPVPNLTTLAQRHGGVFPRGIIESAISGAQPTPAPRISEMPAWGPLFLNLSGHDRGTAYMRMHNLLDYLEGMQLRPETMH